MLSVLISVEIKQYAALACEFKGVRTMCRKEIASEITRDIRRGAKRECENYSYTHSWAEAQNAARSNAYYARVAVVEA